MVSIALATCTSESTLFHDETPLVDYLIGQDISVFPVVWNSPEIDWSSYDLVVLRNTWDYHLQVEVFRAWLQKLESIGITVLNPLSLIRWNIDKSYLQELAAHGVSILPTIFGKQININLAQTLEDNQWQQAVVKPVISGSGDNTWVIDVSNASESQKQFDWLNQQLGMMVQPVAPQIHSDGEYSLVFFGGEYSHAVRKRPPADHIFVHEEQGGSIEVIQPRDSTIKQAEYVISIITELTGFVPTYARIDGILDGDTFVLMECECVEPELYFKRHAEAAERLGSLLIEAIS